MRDQIWWYFARSAGLLTWATACGSIILGLVMSNRRVGKHTNGPWLLDLHRFLSGLTITFMALHMVALWADSFVTFGWAELLLPGASEWRPLPVALGVVAFWILVGVEASSLLKKKIPNRWWHLMHLGSYLVAVLGTAHALAAGSDISNPFVRAIGIVVLTTIIGLTAMRVVEARDGVSPAETEATGRLAAAKRLQAASAPATATPTYGRPAAPRSDAQAEPTPSPAVSNGNPLAEPTPIPVVPVRRMAVQPAPLPRPPDQPTAVRRDAQAATRSR